MLAAMIWLLAGVGAASGQGAVARDHVYDPGQLKPIDSQLKVKAGDPAPDFTLPAVSGKRITLGDFRGRKNVVLSFVPAAWTPVCSDQWPGYNLVKEVFDRNETVLLGITVDNLPTLHAWTREMGGLWFEVLSDFWPHGAVADLYGVLRGDGMSERAMIFIDKEGIVRTTMVTDINKRPDLEACVVAIEEMNRE
jgi:peroxiredoxin (alkyl hydroperoxide reductase subunit C)